MFGDQLARREALYVQPYAPAPDTLTAVNNTVASMSLADKIKQMQGTLFGDAFHTQFNDIQRSQDTDSDPRLAVPRRLPRHEPRRGHGRRHARTRRS